MPLFKLPGSRVLDLSRAPVVMAVINCTPDSFYAPSRSFAEDAVRAALEAVEAGAAIVDIGGESSRPGSAYVEAEEELRRILPVVEGLRKSSAVPVSVDTRKAAVVRAALEAGADIVNDISALEDDPELGPLCARSGAGVILMHKQGVPLTMQKNPGYRDVVAEVGRYLADAAARARGFGIDEASIMLDPGIGFGKRLEDNLDLLAGLAEIGAAGYPVLVGLSRKSFIGSITGREPHERLAGSIAAAVIAASAGAAVLRVHDVRETVDAVRIFDAVRGRRNV